MLCFVETDAALRTETADLLLGVCVKRSFDRASVDGQLSTNDTAILMCSGASGVTIAPGERRRAALRRGARRAPAPAGDHDGRRRRGRRADRARGRAGRRSAQRRGGGSRGGELAPGEDGAARRRPQLGADHPGGRGRPAGHRAAGGRPRRSRAPRCARQALRSPTTSRRSRLRVQAKELEYEIGLPGEGAETEVFFSDLSHQYVTINAEYTT